MSVVIRLAKVGKRGTSIYRIVAVEKRHKRDSDPIEILGSYITGRNKNDLGKIVIDKTRVTHWQSVGAYISPAVQKLLV